MSGAIQKTSAITILLVVFCQLSAYGQSPPTLPVDSSKQESVDSESRSSVDEHGPASASVTPASPRAEEMLGEPIEHTDSWTRLYNSGLKSLQKRLYEDAESKLIAAIKEAKHTSSDDRNLIYGRLALADVYCAQDDFDQAEKLYSSTFSAAQKALGKESEAVAHAAYGLAMVNFMNKNFAKAEPYCKQSISVRRKVLSPNHHDLGESCVLMGVLMGNQGWADEAEPLIARGLWMIEKSPGYKQLDLADALRMVALYRQSRGQRDEAQQLFDKSNRIKEAAVEFDKPQRLAGRVRFYWEAGSPTSQEIPDNDFPVRYINVNGVRVAATIVDLWELMGVLICVTDTGTQRVELGLGKVNLERLSLDPHDTHKEKLTYVDPNSIDRIRRERVMWDLTYTRPWLANMQKTRSTRGFVPPQGHDLFRGPNIFGVYGDWGAISRVLPDKIASEPSPERVVYQAEHTTDSGLERSNNIRILGLLPVPLEPFESRTGEQFYINPRCESVLLTVRIGNATFEIPFKLRKRRIS